eukprot:scaffold85901_cov33-Phaeocystis_antarctica.AAC.1
MKTWVCSSASSTSSSWPHSSADSCSGRGGACVVRAWWCCSVHAGVDAGMDAGMRAVHMHVVHTRRARSLHAA